MLGRLRSSTPAVASPQVALVPTATGNARTIRFISILSTALTMGTSFAHTLEMPSKMRYEGRLWWHLLRTLYTPWWGRAGTIEGVALFSTPGLAYLVRGRRPAFPLTLSSVICLFLANPVVFFLGNQPTNAVAARTSPENLPPNWVDLRNRWEYAHAIRFVFHLIAFCALVTATLADTRNDD
jgi:hypothetical protein